MEFIKKYKIDITLTLSLFILSSFLIFTKLGTKELQNWDEGLYANIAGEMVKTGNYLDLKLQGGQWLEKEPLPFWFEALSIKIFGFNTFALRFPAALLSIFIAPLIYIISRKKLNKMWSFFASTLFLISPAIWFPHMLRTADFDMLSLSLFLATLASYLYLRNKKMWWICAIFMALGLVSRGFMGIIYIGIIFIAEIIRPLFTLQKWNFKKILTFILVSLLPWIIWHIYLFATYTNIYLNVYWKEQFFTRITDPLQGHVGSTSFYINFLQKEMGSLSILFFFFGILSVIYLFIKKRSWYYSFLLIWIFATLLPPHILTTKLEWYILPALPPLYISLFTIPQTLNDFVKNKNFKKYIYGIAIVFLIIYTSSLISQSIQKIQNIRKTPTQYFVHSIQNIIPQEQNIILYNIENWNHGRTLPSFYWYLHYEQNLEIISINKPNLEYYLALVKENPWWIIQTENLQDIEQFKKDFSYSVMTKNPHYMLLHITQNQIDDNIK